MTGVVRLLEEERARSVETARRQVAAAGARIDRLTEDSKRMWALVKAGALAQRRAEEADGAARAATGELDEAQRALALAQDRQRRARQDVEAAMASASEPGEFRAVQMLRMPTLYQPLPFTYRLSIIGKTAPKVRVENGSLGRALDKVHGEVGAWIVRASDPSKIRVFVGEQATETVVKRLPSAPLQKSRV